jgi:cytoskeletal protein CcmA (bactofilin family)
MEPENHGSATIGKAVKVVGKIYSKEDLFVDGDLEGTVEALEHKLTIGPNGTVHADVKAREVAVMGSLQGDVEATDKIEIRKDAKLVGNIKTARILIEDGAYFKGGIESCEGRTKSGSQGSAVHSSSAFGRARRSAGASAQVDSRRQTLNCRPPQMALGGVATGASALDQARNRKTP